jgi:hypothetical protein
MFVVREVLSCKPGKVKPLIEKFDTLSAALQEMGRAPLRVLTDVSGGPFWTVVVEAEVETIETFLGLERQLRANEAVRLAMAGYHELLDGGRREIYRLEGRG